jgi:5-methylcytosine-specific restriction endonuclease McrA
MSTDQVRRFCLAGHIYQLKPTFEPCCPQAQADPYSLRRRQANLQKWGRKRAQQANFWSRIRAFIRLRDKGQCRYCGKKGYEVDHVVPHCNKGDAEAFDNLVWSCGPCNRFKGSERGFSMRNNLLQWHGKIVSPSGIFGEELMNEIGKQRLERQTRQGLTGVVSYKQRGGTST